MSSGIERFIDKDKKVLSWPKKHVDKDLVLAYLITKFDFNTIYNELQVNEILKQWHTFSDWPLLRRELFERGYFDRNLDGSAYKRLK
jgi:hypothetical protein